MEIVFNELSLLSLPGDYYECSEWFYSFFSNCFLISKIIEEKVDLISSLKFSEVYVGTDFSFSRWIGTLPQGQFRSQVLLLITNKQVNKEYPYYSYNGNRCRGLGLAFEMNSISVSFPFHDWTKPILTTLKEYFDDSDQVAEDNIQVRNVAGNIHVEFHKEWLRQYKNELSLVARKLAYPVRIFQHHKKHDRTRPYLNDGNATLLCSNEEAQILLNESIGEYSMFDGRLYKYDAAVKMIVIFNRTIGQIYHGYHLNVDHNRIPPKIRQHFGV